MNALPAWADTDEGRALLDSITASPPETRVDRNSWGQTSEVFRTWKRPDVAALKKLYDQWFEAEFAKLDAVYAVTNFWDDDAAKAISDAEKPDDLIRRKLAEPAPLRRAA